MPNFDDVPITHPNDDRFGFDPFARAIADCIRGLKAPVGSVVAIYGPWGSGKSSVVNLVRHHLGASGDPTTVINFPAWMYRSEDALAVGFFSELYAGLTPALSTRGKAAKALKKLGTRVAGAGNLLGMAAGLFAGSVAENATKGVAEALGNFIGDDEGAETLQKELADALQESSKRFLIIIDDLDRLSPEEALVVFRLIKSVGRLPNVMYLLAYDRSATERAVAARFPSEGPHYLEKIIQAGFELPEPDQSRLNAMIMAFIDEIAGNQSNIDPIDFGNLFHSVVAPELRTPRDVLRLSNTLSITVFPVIADVYLPDFISLEALRVFRPSVYRALRSRRNEVLAASDIEDFQYGNDRRERFEERLLGSEPVSERERLKDALMRLFPQLQRIWANNSYSGYKEWARLRRVCSPEHFDTYFMFAVSPRTVPQKDIDLLLNSSATPEAIVKKLIEATQIFQADGRSKASYLLDELNNHAWTVPLDRAEKILSALFSTADSLLVDSDKGKGFSSGDNTLRLHWLTRAFLLGRTSLPERSAILRNACDNASLEWIAHFSRWAWEQYYPSKLGRKPSSEEEALMTEDDASYLRAYAHGKLKDAADAGLVLNARELAPLLFNWFNLQPEGSNEVQAFLGVALNDDASVAKLAKAFLGTSWSQAMGGLGGGPGDLVSRENDRAQIDGLDKLLNLESFRDRLGEALLSEDVNENDKAKVKRLLAAWDAREQDLLD